MNMFEALTKQRKADGNPSQPTCPSEGTGDGIRRPRVGKILDNITGVSLGPVYDFGGGKVRIIRE